MNIHHLPYSKTGFFSKIIIDYLENEPKLQPFYSNKINIDNVEEWIEGRKKHPLISRNILSETLLKQHSNIKISDLTRQNIELLKEENTFTITTGHQINLFTGPLYFILKIAQTIKYCQVLKQKYPQYNFVPIYWMNTEDHDILEINHFHLFNKKITWNTPQTGAMGDLNTDLLDEIIEQTSEILGQSKNAQYLIEILKKSYQSGRNLAESTRYFVNHFFGKYGLVCLNQNEKALKNEIKWLLKSELTEHLTIKKVKEANEQLEAAGYHSQAMPRAINLFYLKENERLRIEYNTKNELYELIDSNEKYTEIEILDLVENRPEKFSCNVIVRPLYQQYILPNLVYIGGGGELAYWLQLKNAFEVHNCFFPALQLRNSVMWIDGGSGKKMTKFGYKIEDILEEEEVLVKNYVRGVSENELSLKEEKAAIEAIFRKIEEKAMEIDQGLKKSIKSESAKNINSLEKLESKLLRAEKKQHETTTNQIRNLKNKLFPNGKLQERHDNFLQYYLKYGDNFIENLIESLEPFNKEFAVFEG